MNKSLRHKLLSQRIEAVEHAMKQALAALDMVVEAEMAELAKRFPTRRLHLCSGMGSTTLFINRRDGRHDYQINEGDPDDVPLLGYMEEIAPDLWAAIRLVEDTLTDGKDPGFGSILYENGEKVKGLE